MPQTSNIDPHENAHSDSSVCLEYIFTCFYSFTCAIPSRKVATTPVYWEIPANCTLQQVILCCVFYLGWSWMCFYIRTSFPEGFQVNWGAGEPYAEHFRVTMSPSFATSPMAGDSIIGFPGKGVRKPVNGGNVWCKQHSKRSNTGTHCRSLWAG